MLHGDGRIGRGAGLIFPATLDINPSKTHSVSPYSQDEKKLTFFPNKIMFNLRNIFTNDALKHTRCFSSGRLPVCLAAW